MLVINLKPISYLVKYIEPGFRASFCFICDNLVQRFALAQIHEDEDEVHLWLSSLLRDVVGERQTV